MTSFSCRQLAWQLLFDAQWKIPSFSTDFTFFFSLFHANQVFFPFFYSYSHCFFQHISIPRETIHICRRTHKRLWLRCTEIYINFRVELNFYYRWRTFLYDTEQTQRTGYEKSKCKLNNIEMIWDVSGFETKKSSSGPLTAVTYICLYKVFVLFKGCLSAGN